MKAFSSWMDLHIQSESQQIDEVRRLRYPLPFGDTLNTYYLRPSHSYTGQVNVLSRVTEKCFRKQTINMLYGVRSIVRWSGGSHQALPSSAPA